MNTKLLILVTALALISAGCQGPKAQDPKAAQTAEDGRGVKPFGLRVQLLKLQFGYGITSE